MDNRFDNVRTQIEEAKEMISLGKGRHALLSCRTGLEFLVKQLCKDSSISSSTEELDLFNMIDLLYESNVITDNEKDLMHRTRITSNDIHVDLENYEVPIDSAKEATEDLERLLNSVSQRDFTSSAKQAASVNNVPMEYPDYYSSSRRYYGKWSHCMTREQLLVIPEYVELLRKADNGDVEAMLNIANGFLSREIEWNNNKLINMPPYIHRGKPYTNRDAYDARYYSWIMKAVETASERWSRNEYVPMKYIATAIWEVCLFSLYTTMPRLNNYVYDVYEWRDEETKKYHYDEQYKNQYTLEAVNKDGWNSSCYANIRDKCFPFIKYFFETFEGEIISQIHKDANKDSLEKIAYMMLCTRAIESEHLAIDVKNKVRNTDDSDLSSVSEQGHIKYNSFEVENLKNLIKANSAQRIKVGDEIRLELVEEIREEKVVDIYDCDLFYNRIGIDTNNAIVFYSGDESRRIEAEKTARRASEIEQEMQAWKKKEKVLFGVIIIALIIGFFIVYSTNPEFASKFNYFFEGAIAVGILAFICCVFSS